MHATYPVVIRHHPGWFGVLAGVILGVVLTIGGLLVLDRIELGSAVTSDWASSQTAAQLYQAHLALEYRGVPATVEDAAQLYQAHQALEYRGDFDAARAAALRQHFLREHQADMIAP